MVASTKTDMKLGTVEIPHEGPEEYNNIWQKVRSMWSYVYDNYYEKYDWYASHYMSLSSLLAVITSNFYSHLALLQVPHWRG